MSQTIWPSSGTIPAGRSTVSAPNMKRNIVNVLPSQKKTTWSWIT